MLKSVKGIGKKGKNEAAHNLPSSHANDGENVANEGNLEASKDHWIEKLWLWLETENLRLL